LKKKLYRVRFIDQSERKTVEVVVQSVNVSEFMGLVVLENFVFNDNRKLVILPEEDAARTRYGKTDRLHIPYHSLVFVEEFDDEPADLKHLPFVREVVSDDKASEKGKAASSIIPPPSPLKI
jgi:hypothetical protein